MALIAGATGSGNDAPGDVEKLIASLGLRNVRESKVVGE